MAKLGVQATGAPDFPRAVIPIIQTVAAVLRDYDKGLQIEAAKTPHRKTGGILINAGACGLRRSDLHVIGCAAMTASGAVYRGAALRFGETVAVSGSGGVGSNIIQLCGAFGARRIIAIDIADDKLDAAAALGATHTVNSTQQNPAGAAYSLTGGRGVEVAFEDLGRTSTWETPLSVFRGGEGVIPFGFGAAVPTGSIEINRLVRRSQKLVGAYGALARQDLSEIIRLAAEGVLRYRVIVTEDFALEKVAQGCQTLSAGEIQGRPVVNMSKES